MNYLSVACCKNPYDKRQGTRNGLVAHFLPIQLHPIPLRPVSTDPYDPLSAAAIKASREAKEAIGLPDRLPGK